MAIAGLNSSIIANDPHVISADEMSEFAASHSWLEKYKHFICIDILRGKFYASGEWKSLISEYSAGKEISLFTYFSIPSFTSTVVYIKNYVAVVRCTYPIEYARYFKDAGYSKGEIASRFAEFDDTADNSFYVCIRPTTHNFVDLDGNPTMPHSVYDALISCRKQLLIDKKYG